MKADGGGPAFPNDTAYRDERGTLIGGGMTLRDYFAGQALAGMLADGSYSFNGAAQDAYAFADAMLAERERTEANNG